MLTFSALITIGVVLLFFALLIGIFMRLGRPKRYGRCPLCREPIDHHALVCPHCQHEVNRVTMLKEMNDKSFVRGLLLAGAVIVLTIFYMAQPHSEPLTQQDTPYYDASGHRAGTASRDSQGTTTYRDSMGRTTGTATRDSQGTTTFRDWAGRATGSKSRH